MSNSHNAGGWSTQGQPKRGPSRGARRSAQLQLRPKGTITGLTAAMGPSTNASNGTSWSRDSSSSGSYTYTARHSGDVSHHFGSSQAANSGSHTPEEVESWEDLPTSSPTEPNSANKSGAGYDAVPVQSRLREHLRLPSPSSSSSTSLSSAAPSKPSATVTSIVGADAFFASYTAGSTGGSTTPLPSPPSNPPPAVEVVAAAPSSTASRTTYDDEDYMPVSRALREAEKGAGSAASLVLEEQEEVDTEENTDSKEDSAAILNLNFLYDPPVDGCELKPYVLMRTLSGQRRAVEDAKGLVTYQWYRGLPRMCSVRSCENTATFQCMACVTLSVPTHLSFFCSQKCLRSLWASHTQLHAKFHSTRKAAPDPWHTDDDAVPTASSSSDADDSKATACRFPARPPTKWTPVSTNRCFVPSSGDIGRPLRLEVRAILGYDANDKPVLGDTNFAETSGVVGKPAAPPPRRQLMVERHTIPVQNQPFKTVCYNVLAEIYCTRSLYPYCPMWALAWEYRKRNILREILTHRADIICLQEVQVNHYEDFFQPNLSAAGYDGAFLAKTRQAVGADPKAIDGCAVFYSRNRFALVARQNILFDEIARAQFRDPKQLRRVVRGNVAIAVMLEDLAVSGSRTRLHRRRKLCVVNTHMFWDPKYPDVKLWQSQWLCQKLEDVALRQHYPLLICGDFNSRPNSAVYSLLTKGSVPLDHEVFTDRYTRFRLLPSAMAINHRLPLASAYGSVNEPKYTNFTGHFVGVLDYVLYSKNTFAVQSLLEVDSEELLREHTALPSPKYSSDHVSLVVVLDWLADMSS